MAANGTERVIARMLWPAGDLGVADRTVRRWVAGTSKAPAGLYLDLLRLTQERAAVLDDLAPRLREAP